MAAPESPMTGPKPFVFVIMPFSPKFSDLYTYGIKGAAEEVGAYAERIDEQIFSEGILDRIFNQINKADVIVADMTDRNPNVFYEVGYAHALNKVVLLLTQKADDIPFDLQQRQYIVYDGTIADLRPSLAHRLTRAIEEVRLRAVRSRLTVSLAGTELPEFSLGVAAPTISLEKPTANVPFFVLDFTLRNEGVEVLEAISYIYFFTGGLTPLEPVIPKNNSIYDTGLCSIKPEYLYRMGASHDERRKLGLYNQFRLPNTLSPIPPGAVEHFTVYLGYGPEQRDEFQFVESEFALSFFTRTCPYYFPFEIQL